MIHCHHWLISPFKYLYLVSILALLYNNEVLAIFICGRSSYLSHKYHKSMTFVSAHYPKGRESRQFRIHSGWGITDKYSWKENDEFIYLSSSLEPGLKSSQITVNLTKDFIKVEKENSKIPIMEGRTKGKVDVDNSFWTLEEQNGLPQLQITLKKSDPFAQEWFGVLANEKVQLKDYYGGTESFENLKPNSVEPNEVYCTKYFPNVDSKKLGDLFNRWIKREPDEMVPFGKPTTEIGFEYLSERSGDKLIPVGLEQDEYMKVVIKEKEDDPKSSQLVILNGPRTDILKGLEGGDLKERLIRSLNTLIIRFEKDVNKLMTLMSGSKSKESSFDYSGSSASLSMNNLEDYLNYHKSLESIMKGQTKIMNQNEKVTEELKKREKLKLDSEKEANNILQKLSEAINLTENKKPKEQIQTIISNLKKNLSLNTIQMEELFKNGLERLNRQLEDLKKREEDISKAKESDTWFQEQMEPDTIIDKNSDPFDAIMNNPSNIENSLLVKKYHSISKNQKERLKKRWISNGKRLKMLTEELFNAPWDLVSTICNNYRDLLISEDYPTLMKSYVINEGVKDENEREKLNFLNEFVLSLYKDAEIYTYKDEQYQLAKIRQICQWAVNNYENLNELVEKNKHLYDVNFMSYIKLLIKKETEIMEGMEGIQTPDKNPWLSILTIIYMAIKSMIEAEIEEDIYLITTIVYQKVPKVRRHMIEFILATMPRSDWKAFKDLVYSITEGLTNNPPEQGEMKNVPDWIPEACSQLREDIEKMIPDWVIDELLSENDKMLMRENNRRKSPVIQLNLDDKHQSRRIKEERHLLYEKVKEG